MDFKKIFEETTSADIAQATSGNGLDNGLGKKKKLYKKMKKICPVCGSSCNHKEIEESGVGEIEILNFIKLVGEDKILKIISERI